MSKKRIPHPFKPGEHVEGAQVTTGSPSILQAGIAEHVIGHRVTKVEFIRSLDKETSAQLGAPMDAIDLVLYLDNNVAYIARLVLSSFATVSRGEALSHILPGQENYVSEHADNDE